MKNVQESQSSKFDFIKWLIVILLFVGGLVASYYYQTVPLPIRTIGWIFIFACMIGMAAMTAKGKKARKFARDARIELRKVVWPSRQETVQMTVTVVIIVGIAAIVLWGFDTCLMWGMGWLTGQGG